MVLVQRPKCNPSTWQVMHVPRCVAFCPHCAVLPLLLYLDDGAFGTHWSRLLDRHAKLLHRHGLDGLFLGDVATDTTADNLRDMSNLLSAHFFMPLLLSIATHPLLIFLSYAHMPPQHRCYLVNCFTFPIFHLHAPPHYLFFIYMQPIHMASNACLPHHQHDISS